MQTVDFATWFPYTYTRLWEFLKEWEFYWYKNNHNYFERTMLCRTIGGASVPLIKIHYKDENLQKSSTCEKSAKNLNSSSKKFWRIIIYFEM